VALGDSANALTFLERSARAIGSNWSLYIPLEDPAYDVLRPNPGFAPLLQGTGVDVARITSPHGDGHPPPASHGDATKGRRAVSNAIGPAPVPSIGTWH
jgi:hypothetical protein